MSIPIGPYTAGEIPPPLVVTFKDSAGNPLDFSVGAWTGKWIWRQHKPGSSGDFTINDPAVVVASAAVSTSTGATKGQVTYTWTGNADLLVNGDFEGEMWVGNTVNRYASERFTWTTRPAISVPAI